MAFSDGLLPEKKLSPNVCSSLSKEHPESKAAKMINVKYLNIYPKFELISISYRRTHRYTSIVSPNLIDFA